MHTPISSLVYMHMHMHALASTLSSPVKIIGQQRQEMITSFILALTVASDGNPSQHPYPGYSLLCIIVYHNTYQLNVDNW
jgi:hypothetical protein